MSKLALGWGRWSHLVLGRGDEVCQSWHLVGVDGHTWCLAGADEVQCMSKLMLEQSSRQQ